MKKFSVYCLGMMVAPGAVCFAQQPGPDVSAAGKAGGPGESRKPLYFESPEQAVTVATGLIGKQDWKNPRPVL